MIDMIVIVKQKMLTILL